MRIGLVQMPCSADRQIGLARAEAGIRQAAQEGAQVVCLPELFGSLYFCQTEDFAAFDLAETIPGPTTRHLGTLAAELGIVVIGSLFESRAEGLFHNTAVVFDADGTLLGRYRKMHIPDDPSYFEKFYFTPGDLGFRRFDTRFGPLGVLICWDQWFSEGARLTALAGAEILFYPTAIGWLAEDKPTLGSEQHDAWETVQRGHAIGNGLFVAAVNRVGTEAGIEFWGRSFVCDPAGKILARAGQEPETLVVECPREKLVATRRSWPFLRDRRIDAYGDIVKRYLDDSPR